MIILVHDVGTTGNKAALYSAGGRLIAAASQAYPTLETRDGGSEQEPAEWLKAIVDTTKSVMQTGDVSGADISSICVSGHMMGVVALDEQRQPVRNAILHGDTRSRDQIKKIADRIRPARVHEISGNPLDVHYPLSKIAWIRDNEPDVYKQSRVFVQSKDYVTMWLIDKASVTDYSDASLYGCFDMAAMQWSDEICRAAGIGMEKLPDIISSGTQVGVLCREVANVLDLKEGIPVYQGLGDGAAAAFGAGASQYGECYACVGSTAWVATTTDRPCIDPQGRLFTIALTSDRFSSIGTVQCAGVSWDWAVKLLCDFRFEEAESLAQVAPMGANGLLFLPYLTGERSPIWNELARGVWFGLATSHSRGDMLRSVIEGVALALQSIYNCICSLTQTNPTTIRLIGGVLRSRLWQDVLTGAFGCQTSVAPDMTQATARGAFMVAAVGAKIIEGFDKACQFDTSVKTLLPDADLTAGYGLMNPLFDQIYMQLTPSFDDLADLRLRLAALDKCDAPV